MNLSSSEREGTLIISACYVCSADILDNRVHRFLKEQGVGSEMAEAIMGIISSIGMANFGNNVSCPGSQCPIFTSFGKSSSHIPYDKCCLQLEAAMMVHHSKEVT